MWNQPTYEDDDDIDVCFHELHKCINVMFKCLCIQQLRPHLEHEDEYGLNVDIDVVLWLDSRTFQNKLPSRKYMGSLL